MNPTSADNRPSRFVFQDLHGHRWPRLRRVLVIWSLLAGLGFIWFIWSVLVRPELRLPPGLRKLKGELRAAIEHAEPPSDDVKASEWEKFYQSPSTAERLPRIRGALKKVRPAAGEVRLGFCVDWDPNSFLSLEEHASSLTHVTPEWFSLVGTAGDLVTEPDPRLPQFCADHGIALLPLLSNLLGDTWQPEAVENIARGSSERRARFISDLIAGLKSARAAGVLIDWEQLDPSYTDDYTALLVQLAEALHHVDLEIWLLVAPGVDYTTFDLSGLQLTVDRFVATLHDENSENDAPGPIASLPWIQGWLKVMSEFGEPDQWVGVLGVYAYDWNTTTRKAETISFKDAMTRASYAGIDQGPKPVLVAGPNYNGAYPYSEPNGDHRVSFLDAISFHNQLRLLRDAKLGGIGVSRLGTEDPQIWEILETRGPLKPAAISLLEPLISNETVTHVGRGEVVSVDDSRDDGRRLIALDAQGLLTAKYVDFPTYPTLYHQGAGSPHQVAITFDDGPDPTWTPKILDLLKQYGVKACFFLVGEKAEEYPRLVRRIIDEGHEIGNHTYSHANLATMSRVRLHLELNMTQRVIESITGRSTTLFRPPYNADSNPATLSELLPLKIAQEDLGYTVVLESIDPQDWARPGVPVILQRVKDLRGEGSIILLHDAGGDRSQTVAALPLILNYLRERGDEVVPVSTLTHISRDDLMPVAAGGAQSVERMVSGTGFQIWRAFIGLFWSFMIFATAVVALRTLIVARLAHRHHRRTERVPPPLLDSLKWPVSVVIAAFNEGKVIAKTLRSILNTDYTAPLEIIVVDDGSSDDTVNEVERLAAEDSRITLVRQPNRGKALALTQGVNRASHQIVVFLDADTLLERGTIPALVAPFTNPLVGAVSGNARVGNARNFITRCQSLEYICGFNLDRRAYTEWNCITVVPGAISAMRRQAIEAAGGFSHDTLAEDTDLTLTLHRLRYRIEFAPDAIAWTEAPETLPGLAKQRFRWAFGTMQCLWKHRDLVLSPRHGALGWFSLPGIWFFQIALVALTPLVDVLLLWSIFAGTATAIWWYFLVFLGMELFLSALACHLEKEPMHHAWRAIPMRLVYRPMLAWVIWRSIFRALKGALVGWGKLERTASVPSRA